MCSRLLLCLLIAFSLNAQWKLLLLSIDGMDNRYLRDADQLGLRIPTLRRLMKEGAVADGVQGIVPTVTWPSHTTMLTFLLGGPGVKPRRLPEISMLDLGPTFAEILGLALPAAQGRSLWPQLR